MLAVCEKILNNFFEVKEIIFLDWLTFLCLGTKLEILKRYLTILFRCLMNFHLISSLVFQTHRSERIQLKLYATTGKASILCLHRHTDIYASNWYCKLRGMTKLGFKEKRSFKVYSKKYLHDARNSILNTVHSKKLQKTEDSIFAASFEIRLENIQNSTSVFPAKLDNQFFTLAPSYLNFQASEQREYKQIFGIFAKTKFEVRPFEYLKKAEIAK